MRVIDSVLALNRERRHRTRIFWLRDRDLNCRFDELFERPSGVDGVFDFATASSAGKFLKFLLPRVLQNIASRAIHQKEMDSLLAGGLDFSSLLKLRSIYFRTWDRFFTGENPLAEFRLVPKLQAIVDGCNFERRRTVGIHIRRTDSPWCGESPTEAFTRLMNEEIAERADTIFFVATDDPEEEAHLQRLFSGRILSHRKKNLDRNSPDGIKDAAVDLYCLSRCRKIIGTNHSSFSEAASQIGHCPLVVARNGAGQSAPLAVQSVAANSN